MVPLLIDLESTYDSTNARSYDPRELIRYALGSSDYWAELALAWLDQGAPRDGLDDALLDLEGQSSRSQPVRHHARRVRKGV